MLKVFLSPLAERQLLLLLDFLESEWSQKTRKSFLDKILKAFDRISSQPRSCPESQSFPNLYKCVVSKQTSFYYRIVDDEIEIIAVMDNRENPDRIEEQLNHWR